MLATAPLDSLLDFLVAWLASPELARNPHLRAKFGEVRSWLAQHRVAALTRLCARCSHACAQVLFEVFLPPSAKSNRDDAPAATGGLQERALVAHPRAQRFLMPSLVALYGDVEATGCAPALALPPLRSLATGPPRPLPRRSL